MSIQISQRSFECKLCKSCVSGHKECIHHLKDMHHKQFDNINDEEIARMVDSTFDWVLLQPGPGHIEMNMVRAYIEMTWDIF